VKKTEKVSNVIQEFSRFATEYEQYNIIQSKVATTLVSMLPLSHYQTIIDLGAGSGKVYQNLMARKITFQEFIALDSSKEMLALHPNGSSIKKICADFNLPQTFEQLKRKEEVMLLSSSALQWSRNLDFTFSQLSQVSQNAFFAIFTSNTFKTLHRIAGVSSPIHTTEALKKAIDTYYKASYTIEEYTLHFNSAEEMLRYIKRSGVSGGERKLGYKEIKTLIKQYPLEYLEFEILFVKAEKK